MDPGRWTPGVPSFKSSTDPYGNTISWKRADGTGDAQVLVHSTAALLPGSWHPNKKLLAYVATMPGTGEDVMILPVEGDEVGGWRTGKPTAFVSSAARERAPTFSPDGRWLRIPRTNRAMTKSTCAHFRDRARV